MKKLILALSIISIFSLSSCTVTKTVINDNGKITNETTNDENNTDIKRKSPEVSEYYTNNKTDGTIYYFVPAPNAEGFDIIEEKVDNISDINLEDLLKKEIELSSAIPKETVINSIKVEDKIAYVDVNSIFSEDPNTNSSTLAILKVYSLVNVLYYNRFLEIDGVNFLIDGTYSDSISILSNKNLFVGSDVYKDMKVSY